jgi:hypothetical protein
MPKLLGKNRFRTPEDIAERCERYGVPIEEIPNLSDYWFTRICSTPNKNPGKINNCAEMIRLSRPWEHFKTKVPYPKGIERYSPEFWRIFNHRKTATRRAFREGKDPFLIGYHDIETYTPLYSTKASDQNHNGTQYSRRRRPSSRS